MNGLTRTRPDGTSIASLRIVTLTLSQSQAIDELMLLLVDWLPGSSPWGSYTFAEAAAENQVAEFWRGGSKKPALTDLLRLTYDARRNRFCPLVLTIVQHGMSYRRQKGLAVQRKEVERLNAVIEQLSLKIPELWDPAFLGTLPSPTPEPDPDPPPAARTGRDPRSEMPPLYDRFMELYREADRAKAGRDFEVLLHDLLGAWGLAPSRNYRVPGEEVDNSFLLDGVTYLLEAKWTGERTQAQSLYAFRQKVASKSAYTRGLFLSVEGFTEGAVTGLSTGQEQRLILLDGAHLMRVLTGVPLPDLLRLASRHLEQLGEALLPHGRLSEIS